MTDLFDFNVYSSPTLVEETEIARVDSVDGIYYDIYSTLYL